MTHQILDALLPLAVAIETLHPDPANARKHGNRNLDSIKASLAKFGQRKPIVVQRQGMIVRAGNGTMEAAKALGWTEIAAVVVDESDIAATGYAIADNRSAELAEWDEDILGQLLTTLDADANFDATLTGFTAAEIERLQKPAQGLCDPDDVPDPPALPVTQPGDLWVLGDHRIICGDSTDAATVTRVLAGEKPRVLLTDAPYGVELDMEWRDRAGLNQLGPAEASYMQQRAEGHRNTTISGDTRADWSEAYELVPTLDTAYCWHASAHTIEVGTGLLRIGFGLKQLLVWVKPHFVLSRSHYHWQHEPCWYARKPGAAPWRGSRDQSTVWTEASPKMLMNPGGNAEEKWDHPTQKPIALYTRPIENHTEKGDWIYEPFSGSGTCVAAAEQTGRRCLAVEIDAKYVDVCVERWQRFSGGKAERVRP